MSPKHLQFSGPYVMYLSWEAGRGSPCSLSCPSPHLGYLMRVLARCLGGGSTQLLLGPTLPPCPVALVALPSVLPKPGPGLRGLGQKRPTPSPWIWAQPSAPLPLLQPSPSISPVDLSGAWSYTGPTGVDIFRLPARP